MFGLKDKSPRTDLEIIEVYKGHRDPALLGELFVRYSPLVYGVCLKYLKDRDDAKDAVMQIFERLNKSLLEHTISYFRGWLYTTTRNHCLMQLRSRQAHGIEKLDESLMENSFVMHLEEEVNSEMELSRLQKCIEELKDEQKDCVRLFYLKEKCYQDIATITGFDLKQVKSYIQNGKRNLKICMEQNG